MSKLSDQQIDAIAQQVVRQMGGGGNAPVAKGVAGVMPQAPAGGGQHRLGAFQELDAAVKAARAAFEALDKLTLAKRDEIIASIRRWSLRELSLIHI